MKTVKKVWVITYDNNPIDNPGDNEMPRFYFLITSPEGKSFEGTRPRLLAKIAWKEDADEVHHDYDLRLDPDL